MSAIALAVLQPQCGRGRPPPPATAAAAAAATRRGLRQPQTGQRTDWSCACIGRLAGEGRDFLTNSCPVASSQCISLYCLLLPHSGAPRRSAVIGNSSRTRSSRRRRPQGAAAAAGAAAAVDIAIEPGPANSRCIWAGVDVAAPAGMASTCTFASCSGRLFMGGARHASCWSYAAAASGSIHALVRAAACCQMLASCRAASWPQNPAALAAAPRQQRLCTPR